MSLFEILERISLLKDEVDQFRPIAPSLIGRIMQKFRLEWNFHSNNLEGNSLTYGETKVFLLHGLTASGKPIRDHLEIQGHNEAIQGLEDMVQSDRPLTEHEIRSIHQVILGEPYESKAQTPDGQTTTRLIQPGKYKTQPNHVLTATGETFYFTEPEQVEGAMGELLEWYATEQEQKSLAPLVFAATLHYRFIRIHPFDDGNGRMARLLMNLVLMKNGLPPLIIRTEEKEDYYNVLRQADGGELEPFIEYLGTQLLLSLELMLKGARGEEIEELGDLDKNLKLLSMKVQGKGNTENELTYGPEVTQELIEGSILPFMRMIHVTINKFEEYFQTIDQHITTVLKYRNKLTALQQLSAQGETLEQFAINLPQYNKGEIEKINLVCKFRDFLSRPHIKLEKDIWIFIDFSIHMYTVFCTALSNPAITHAYSEPLTQPEIEKLCLEIGNNIIALIEETLELK